MGYIGTKPADAALTSADIEDGVVTAAKLATDSVETAKVKDLNVTVAKLPAAVDISTKTVTLPATVAGLGTGIDVTSQITGTVPTGNLGTGTADSTTYLAGNQTYKTTPAEYDDDVLQSNVAMLGFKVAVNGSLTRYNLVDQSIDEFFDTSGVDAATSANDIRTASGDNYYYVGGSSSSPVVTQDADATGVDGDYTWYKWTDTGATGSYNNASTQSHEWLVVGGGGSGERGNGGGGGAGGYRAGTTLSLTGGTAYTVTVGAGGAGVDHNVGNDGNDSSLAGTGITTITSNGGGRGDDGPNNGHDGASGGGGGYGPTTGGAGNTPAITQYTAAGETTTVQGFAGGAGSGGASPALGTGGGGGASEVGQTGTSTYAGDGGIGIQNDITGTNTWYAGGGGGAAETNTAASGNNDGGDNGFTQGGGGKGKGSDVTTVGYSDATANTGGGAGSSYQSPGTGYVSGNGGSGIVVLRRLTNIETVGGDLTLQSTDVTAVAEPDFGEFVTLIENAYGTAILNTDIKGYVSRDSGTTFTQGTLVDEGTWGTNKKVLGFHDLDISTQPSGTSMCYKITTHNEVASTKEIRVYATSIGWR